MKKNPIPLITAHEIRIFFVNFLLSVIDLSSLANITIAFLMAIANAAATEEIPTIHKYVSLMKVYFVLPS